MGSDQDPPSRSNRQDNRENQVAKRTQPAKALPCFRVWRLCLLNLQPARSPLSPGRPLRAYHFAPSARSEKDNTPLSIPRLPASCNPCKSASLLLAQRLPQDPHSSSDQPRTAVPSSAVSESLSRLCAPYLGREGDCVLDCGQRKRWPRQPDDSTCTRKRHAPAP